MINVLVVDDSAVAREVLVHLINRTPDMHVIGVATDGIEAVAAAQQLRPDIISMDIVMPRLSGAGAIRRIMQTAPTPIVVVTGNTITEEVRATFESLDSGALAIVPRPTGTGSGEFAQDGEPYLRTLRLMAEIKVVRRIPRITSFDSLSLPVEPAARTFRIVALGASTGGPSALKSIISELPKEFPVPILVAQHIAPGFVGGFAEWLGDCSKLAVELGVAGTPMLPGHVYLAPDGSHLEVEPCDRLALAPPESRGAIICPSIDRLFTSVARIYREKAVGVLLTGMGRDGANGLLKLRQAGSLTMAQDKESSIVFGMPAEAIALGAADHVVAPARVAELLSSFAASGALIGK